MKSKKFLINLLEKSNFSEILEYRNAVSQFRQSPLDHLESMESVLKEVLAEVDSSCVAGIGVDTTGSTIGAVDANGTSLALLPGFEENPNAMFVLWKDHTAAFEAEKINAAASQWTIDYRKYTGSGARPKEHNLPKTL